MIYLTMAGATAAALIALFCIINLGHLAFRLNVRKRTAHALQWILGYTVVAALAAPVAWLLFSTST